VEAVELTPRGFWADDRPVVMAPPALKRDGRELAERLLDHEWARGAVVFASSGSSGAPKWIMHRREGLRCSAREVNRHLNVTGGNHWFLALPQFHVGGFGVAARAFSAGCGFTALSGRWDAERFVAELAASGGTHTSLVPTQVFDLVQAGLTCPDGLRAVVVGGGALRPGLGRKARELGWPVLQSYGLTEAGSQVATAGMASLESEFRSAPLPIMHHWQARAGDGGILELRGPALFEAYLTVDGSGIRRGEIRPDGWFATTDLVELGERTLRFLGRSDRLVKVLGELVNLVELESRLLEAWDGRVECRVLALEDARSGRQLVPVFEGQLPAGAVSVVHRLNARLPGFSRLKEPRVTPKWPRTPLGKVDMEALEQRVAGR
jgi:O-succinylbenzoic acid--CoA ligase